ncbi:MAG TPA: hypothetical protein VL993_05850 [Stellaceae bacterium]|nr:hypothetical protein [Stellaceae bacterium]
MKNVPAMQRFALAALPCLCLAGCGPYTCMLTLACGTSQPHTDYFMVTFLPDTPAPSESGLDAIDNAVRQAQRQRPQSIAITGTAPSQDDIPPLEKQRADGITAAFVKAGIDARLIHTTIRPDPQVAYDQGKDSFTVGLDYGNLPQR